MKKQKSIKPLITIFYYLIVGSTLAYLFRPGGSEQEGWLGFTIFRGAFLLSGVFMVYTLNKAMNGDREATLVAMVHAIALFSSVVRLVIFWSAF